MIGRRQEDLLTSNVFQLLRYLPLELGLKPLLSMAVSVDNKYFNLPGDAADFKIIFWCKHSNSEPDVHIKLYNEADSVCMNIFVEVKYGSVKSGNAQDDEESDSGQVDQLKREWDDLCHVSKDIDCALVYLTSDKAFPEGDINESVGAIGNIYGAKFRGVKEPAYLNWLIKDGIDSPDPTKYKREENGSIIEITNEFLYDQCTVIKKPLWDLNNMEEVNNFAEELENL